MAQWIEDSKWGLSGSADGTMSSGALVAQWIELCQVGPHGWNYVKWGRSGLLDRSITSGALMAQWLEDSKWGLSGSADGTMSSGALVAQWIELCQVGPQWLIGQIYIKWGLNGSMDRAIPTCDRSRSLSSWERKRGDAPFPFTVLNPHLLPAHRITLHPRFWLASTGSSLRHANDKRPPPPIHADPAWGQEGLAEFLLTRQEEHCRGLFSSGGSVMTAMLAEADGDVATGGHTSSLQRRENCYFIPACLARGAAPWRPLVIIGATVAERLACSPPTKAIRIRSSAGSLRIFACGNRAGRCRWSACFLGVLSFPPPFHSGAASFLPQSPASALNTSVLRATQPLNAGNGSDIQPLNAGNGSDIQPLNAGNGSDIQPLNAGNGSDIQPLNAGNSSDIQTLNAGNGSDIQPLNAGNGSDIQPLNADPRGNTPTIGRVRRDSQTAKMSERRRWELSPVRQASSSSLQRCTAEEGGSSAGKKSESRVNQMAWKRITQRQVVFVGGRVSGFRASQQLCDLVSLEQLSDITGVAVCYHGSSELVSREQRTGITGAAIWYYGSCDLVSREQRFGITGAVNWYHCSSDLASRDNVCLHLRNDTPGDSPKTTCTTNIPEMARPVVSCTRMADVVLSRLRIGHTCLTHRYLLRGEVSPECGECGSRRSPEYKQRNCRVRGPQFHNGCSNPTIPVLWRLTTTAGDSTGGRASISTERESCHGAQLFLSLPAGMYIARLPSPAARSLSFPAVISLKPGPPIPPPRCQHSRSIRASGRAAQQVTCHTPRHATASGRVSRRPFLLTPHSHCRSDHRSPCSISQGSSREFATTVLQSLLCIETRRRFHNAFDLPQTLMASTIRRLNVCKINSH
ncbi:hypothetical protein PR048_028284 [Dryococelus australis]|uniref:Uncharacterized protein n=1 Tax=Dryococelus australis TaxID=614101 RepID=A0ABQ9GIX2_9NEOP|nr:hypothetical protein PR048_028284 [Dryococelus australis]